MKTHEELAGGKANRVKKIDHKYTSEIVCPRYGYEYNDSEDFGSGRVETGQEICDDCRTHFWWVRDINIVYSTQELETKKDDTV